MDGLDLVSNASRFEVEATGVAGVLSLTKGVLGVSEGIKATSSVGQMPSARTCRKFTHLALKRLLM